MTTENATDAEMENTMENATEAEINSRETVMESGNTKKLNGAKQSRLESVMGNVTRNIDYSFKFNECVMNKLRSDLKSNESATVEYMV